MPFLKILVTGDVRGRFKELFDRVALIQKKKGAFHYLLCVGSFFGQKDSQWEHYIHKGLDIPVKVLILGPNSEDELEFYPDNINSIYEYNDNLIFLGKQGFFTTSEGLTIAYISGVELSENADKKWTIKKEDIRIPPRGRVIHMLLSSAWPEGIVERDKSNFEPRNSSKTVAHMASKWMPYYHFSGWENKFYERTPYKNVKADNEIHSITRFIALGNIQSTERWMHAVQFDPERLVMSDSNVEVTNSPYLSDLETPLNYRFDMSVPGRSQGRGIKRRDDDATHQKKTKFDSDSCWSCLSGKSENHLVIHVDQFAYLSLNKGGLVSQHLSISPIEHITSMRIAGENVIRGVNRLKKMVRKYFSSFGLEVIFYERNYKTFHAQIDCVPLLPEVLEKSKQIFEENAEALNLSSTFSDRDLIPTLPPSQLYFSVEFSESSFFLIEINSSFPLAFGRDILCKKEVLNVPERVEWKNCLMPKEEEIRVVNAIKMSLDLDHP